MSTWSANAIPFVFQIRESRIFSVVDAVCSTFLGGRRCGAEDGVTSSPGVAQCLERRRIFQLKRLQRTLESASALGRDQFKQSYTGFGW